MCHERERLIGYVYDECEPAERQQVSAHLAGCETCRQEIGALRAVRDDLLAWDVPEHGSVWRPFVPARVAPSWRDVPAWAMAAAAAVVFMAGAAGGAVSQAWLNPGPAALRADSQTPAAVRTTATPSADDLARIEERLVALVRDEVDDRVEQVAARELRQMPRVTRTGATAPIDMDEVIDRLSDLERWKYNQIDLNIAVDEKLRLLNNGRSRSDLLQQVSYGPLR